MAEFVTVTKGGQEKQVIKGRQLRLAEADGWVPAGTKRVETETGEQTVPTAEALATERSGRGTIVSEQEIQRRRGAEYLEEKYGDRGVEAFGLGAVSSIPLVGGYAAKKLGAVGGDEGETAAIRKTNEGAFATGQIAGTVLQTVAPTGLAGLGGKIAGATPGGLIARGASAIGSRGSSKAAAYAAEGIADAAAWTVAQNHANAIIADKPVNVEMLAAGLTTNVIMGGVLGGAIGKTTSVLSKRARKIAESTSDFSDPAAWQAARDRLAKEVLETKKAVSDLKLSDPGYAKAARTANKKAAKAQKAFEKFKAKPVAAETFDELSGSLADDISVHVTGSARKQAAAVEKVIRAGKYLDGTVDDLNKVLADYADLGHRNTNIDVKKFDSNPDFAVTKLTDESGALSKFGEGLANEGVQLELVNDPGSTAMVRSWAAKRVGAAKQAAAGAADEAGLLAKFDEAQEVATGATARADFHAGASNKTKQRASDAAYELKKFQIDNAKPKTAKEPQRPTGLIAQLSDATVGRMSRAISYGQKKISSSIGSFAKGATKYRRGTVPAASTILNKIQFDADVGEKPGKSKNRKKEMLRVQRELDSLMSNPEKAKQKIATAMRTTELVKPSMHMALTDKAMQRYKFLHGLVPRSPNLLAFQQDQWLPSDTEIDKFTRILAAAEDPYSLLDDMNAGQLTQEAVDTVRYLYPEIYHSMQMEIIENVDEIKANVKYKGRLQLGILFQAPTDQVLDPGFGQIMQENYAIRAQEQEEQGGGQFSTPGNTQKSIDSTQTASQRIESK